MPHSACASRRALTPGTEATVRQPYVEDLAARFASDCTVIRHGSAALVDLVEHQTQHTRVGADRERALVVCETAGERHEAAGSVALGKGLGTPGRRAAAPLAWFWVKRRIPAGYKPRLLALLALGGLQGAPLKRWFVPAAQVPGSRAVHGFRGPTIG